MQKHSDDSRSEERQDEFTPAILLVILGASGDLTKRLLLPSLYNLASVQALPDDFRLLGVATEEWDDAAMRAHVKDSIAKFWGEHPDEAITGWIAERTFYQQTDLKDEAAYAQLAQRVQESEEQLLVKNVNRLFYLALAPDFIAPVTAQLARAQMFADQEGSWRRLIIEKPFGRDHDSAVELTRDLRKSLRDEQIYRIDHFIGKEALHDIAVVRFANVFLESIWHRGVVDSVQITVAETVGLENRAAFYEKSGALRDMVPNHIAELLSVVAMERPASFQTEDVRAEQVKVLQAIVPIPAERVALSAVRAQYTPGRVKDGPVAGYRDEPDVAADSAVETYVALKLEINNDRWSGVPFYVRTGKRMVANVTEVVLQFKTSVDPFFQAAPGAEPPANALFFRLKPDNGVHLDFGAKTPGMETRVMAATMVFKAPPGPFGDHGTGYERLLQDAILGNQTLFQREDFVGAGWSMVQPLLDAWRGPEGLKFYAAGTNGPSEADELLAQDGREWRSLESV